MAWLFKTSYLDIFSASLIFLICIAFHELGHGSSCLNRTGLVGYITGRFHMSIPVITTDVSSIHYASNHNRAAIAISGVIFQAAISVAFLLLPSEIARVGASFSLMSVAFALAPLPGSDGYWFLSDLFHTKIVGCLGPKGRKDWIGITYTFSLLVVTIYFSYKLINIGLSQLDHFMTSPTHRIRSLLRVLSGVYACVVAILFVNKVIAFLKNGQA